MNKQKLKEILIENFINKKGVIDISGLDFTDNPEVKKIIFSSIKGDLSIEQSHHQNRGKIYQGEHGNIGMITQCFHRNNGDIE